MRIPRPCKVCGIPSTGWKYCAPCAAAVKRQCEKLGRCGLPAADRVAQAVANVRAQLQGAT